MRTPSSCNASVAAEAELAAQAAEGTDCAPEGGSAEETEEQQEGRLCGAEGGEAGAAAGAAVPHRSASHTSWADEADAEEAEELEQRMEAAAPALLPPPPPPAAQQPQQLRSTPPAEALLQALRSSSAAAAAAAATADPADSGSPVGRGVLPPPGFRPRHKAAVPAMQTRPRLQPTDLVGTNGGEGLAGKHGFLHRELSDGLVHMTVCMSAGMHHGQQVACKPRISANRTRQSARP